MSHSQDKPLHETRRFLRVEANLCATVNGTSRATLKRLSLGGCTLELPKDVTISGSVRLEFTVGEDRFAVSAEPDGAQEGSQLNMRFDTGNSLETLRLMNALETIHRTATNQRPVRVRTFSQATIETAPGNLTNISEAGCFVETRKAPFPGDVVSVRFALEKHDYVLAAQVRWKNESGVGLIFLSLAHEERKRLAEFVNRNLVFAIEPFSDLPSDQKT